MIKRVYSSTIESILLKNQYDTEENQYPQKHPISHFGIKSQTQSKDKDTLQTLKTLINVLLNFNNKEKKEREEKQKGKEKEEKYCHICQDFRYTTGNPIISCKSPNCQISVHFECFYFGSTEGLGVGVGDVKEGLDMFWYCDVCIAESPSSVECAICPFKTGPMKRLKKNLYIHPLCYLWTPELQLQLPTPNTNPNINTNTYNNINTNPFKNIKIERYNQQCHLCLYEGNQDLSLKGVCLKCVVGGCRKWMHILCGVKYGLLGKRVLCMEHINSTTTTDITATNITTVANTNTDTNKNELQTFTTTTTTQSYNTNTKINLSTYTKELPKHPKPPFENTLVICDICKCRQLPKSAPVLERFRDLLIECIGCCRRFHLCCLDVVSGEGVGVGEGRGEGRGEGGGGMIREPEVGMKVIDYRNQSESLGQSVGVGESEYTWKCEYCLKHIDFPYSPSYTTSYTTTNNNNGNTNTNANGYEDSEDDQSLILRGRKRRSRRGSTFSTGSISGRLPTTTTGVTATVGGVTGSGTGGVGVSLGGKRIRKSSLRYEVLSPSKRPALPSLPTLQRLPSLPGLPGIPGLLLNASTTADYSELEDSNTEDLDFDLDDVDTMMKRKRGRKVSTASTSVIHRSRKGLGLGMRTGLSKRSRKGSLFDMNHSSSSAAVDGTPVGAVGTAGVGVGVGAVGVGVAGVVLPPRSLYEHLSIEEVKMKMYDLLGEPPTLSPRLLSILQQNSSFTTTTLDNNNINNSSSSTNMDTDSPLLLRAPVFQQLTNDEREELWKYSVWRILSNIPEGVEGADLMMMLEEGRVLEWGDLKGVLGGLGECRSDCRTEAKEGKGVTTEGVQSEAVHSDSSTLLQQNQYTSNSNTTTSTNSNKIERQPSKWDGDLYKPLWTRGYGKSKEGWCGLCLPGVWLKTKTSVYWYHLHNFHGVSSGSGNFFKGPDLLRGGVGEVVGEGTQILEGSAVGEGDLEVGVGSTAKEGFCSGCQKWIVIRGEKCVNVEEIYWYKHKQKCLRICE